MRRVASLKTELVLILGGARSGKSSYAENLAARLGQNVLYIATAQAGDAEMVDRIEKHRRERPDNWQTLEAPLAVGAALARLDAAPDVLLLDCMTLLTTNLLLTHEEKSPAQIELIVQAEVDDIVAAHRKLQVPLIIVSNEVGLGVVPPYPLGRVYRDVLGRANQRLAAAADCVLFMIAGLPMALKGSLET
jgi:adenosylcobinamide kinase/adenosylcobinamide-phosphate guanylyltransferase